MHKESFEIMKYFVEKYLNKNKITDILEVGSYNVNGTYKSLFNNSNWNYLGLDMRKGPNVDFVSKSAYEFGLGKQFDIVVSGNCLNHVEAPWKWIWEVYNVTKKGGIICIINPLIGENKHPFDCWRILPDGYKYLLEKECRFSVLETKVNIPETQYRFFINRPKYKWITKIIPKHIKNILTYDQVQDSYVIAQKTND